DPSELGHVALGLGQPGQVQHGAHRERERGDHRAAREHGRAAPGQTVADQQIEHDAGERQRGDDPQQRQVQGGQPLSRWISSTNTVSRRRNRCTMMARPIATSAAATVMTKNTKICPSSDFRWLANATNARFAALSISSTLMKMTSALRRMSTPT